MNELASAADGEEPVEANRGWFFPRVLVELYENHGINAEEMMLLGKINALCDPEKGCWASNQWLADWWGKTADWVSRCITRFDELGLIKVRISKKRGNKRILWAAFQPDELSEKSQIAIGEKSDSYRRKVRAVLSTTNRHRRIEHAGTRPVVPGSVPSLGLSGEHKYPRLVKEFANFTIENHLHLGKRGSTVHGWTKATLLDWEERLNSLLSQVNGEAHQVESVMQWYFKHWKEDYTPQAYTLRSFCERYLELRRAMKRQQKDGDDDNRGPTGRLVEHNYTRNGVRYTESYIVPE